MKLPSLLALSTLLARTTANLGAFEYNHMLGIWLPKHEVFTDEHHHANPNHERHQKPSETLSPHHAHSLDPGHDHDMDHHLTFYPHPPVEPPKTTPRLIIYVQTFVTPEGNPLSLLPLLEYETRVTHVILASVHLHEQPGEIRLNNDPFDAPVWDQIWDEVKLLQENGVKVMVMLGGAAAGTYKRLNGTDKEFYSYYYPLRDLIKKYNLDGLDLDIEESVPLSVPIRLLTTLNRDLGPDFILTMAPLASALSHKDGQNLSGFSYFSLDKFATVPGSDRKLVHWYNGMFYGGFARGPPFYQSVIDQGWDPERIVMGVLDCSDDGQPNGFVHIETLSETIQSLRRQYGGFGGVSGWEYWDAGRSEFEVVEPWVWVKKVGDALFEQLPVWRGREGWREEV